MQTYEVEVKALLGSAERAEEVRRAMKTSDTSCKLQSKNKQLNHYFEGGDLPKLVDVIVPDLPAQDAARFRDLARRATKYSVRTRDKDGQVFLVVKASVDDTTSENGITRIEFEEEMKNMSLAKLDELVQWAGFKYQAKWSREREEYVCKGTNVTLDKNAGYGWLAEFERVVGDESELGAARNEIRALMRELRVGELAQDRLERMFAYYNAHWPEYYGTDKIFVIE